MLLNLVFCTYSVLCLPPFGSVPSSAEEVQYVHVVQLDEIVAFQRSGIVYFGHLDNYGNFCPSEKHTPEKKGEFRISGLYGRRINFPLRRPNEEVFEYRSGLLISGVLDEEGNFIPELNSKVIPFVDYKYSKNARRIYNLPGYFIEKDKLIMNKKSGAEEKK